MYDYSHGQVKNKITPAIGTGTTFDKYGNPLNTKKIDPLQKQEDLSIEEDFEDFLTELSYVNFNDNIYEEIADADVQFYTASRSVVIRGLRSHTYDVMNSHLEGVKKWNDNTLLSGEVNVTVPFDSIQAFLETFSAQHKRTGAIQ